MGLLDNINNGIDQVNGAIASAKSLIGGATNLDAAVSLTYPLDLRQESTTKYPLIRFLAKDESKNEKIFHLPMPAGGITFNDGGTYGQIDLGIIAGTLAAAVDEQGIGGGAAAATGSLVNTFKATSTGDILAKIVTDNQKVQFALGKGKQLAPPNSNTTFSNNNMRSFGFQFKMTANSTKESLAIKEIVTHFRRLVYAANSQDDQGGLFLSYPPTWKISFLDWNDGTLGNNIYLPQIGESYLTSLTTVYNASSNLFHVDGAPTEVDITLNFQEAKVHTRSDIDALNARSLQL